MEPLHSPMNFFIIQSMLVFYSECIHCFGETFSPIPFSSLRQDSASVPCAQAIRQKGFR